MDENKTAFKIALGALVALAVVAALWRVLAYEPGARPAAAGRSVAEKTVVPGAHSKQNIPVSTQEVLSELLPEDVSASAVSTSTASAPARPVRYAPNPSVRPTVYPQNRASRKAAYPARSSQTGRYVDTNFYDAFPKVPYTQASATFHSQAEQPAVGFTDSSSQRMQEERAQMLAPYLRPNRKQQEQMDEKWAKLSAAIDRAVLQALTPKSKKEQMLEKYAPKQAENAAAAQENGLTGPFAPVVNAIAAQKNDIVKSFAQAFGSSAARQAGSLMDSFASEVAAAAGAPNVSAQQAAQQVQAITKKYQQKMEKLEQKSQYDKFVADRVAQDTQQKEELGALYPNEKAQIAQLIDQTREKDLALATQNLPRQEYFNQLAQHNQALRSGIQKLVVQGGQSVQDFQKWEQGQTQQYLEKLNALEASGQIQSVATVATPDEQKRTQADIKTGQEFLNKIVSSLGEESRADFEPILQQYEQDLKRIDGEKLSPAQRQAKRNEALKQFNRQQLTEQIKHVEKMDIPDGQKQQILQELNQSYNNLQ